MRTVKRLVVCLTCLVVLLSSFCISSSAYDFNVFTGEDLLYNADEDCYYAPYKPLDWDPMSLMSASEPHNKNFDINLLPWVEMPSYVQDILYNQPVGNVKDTSYTGEVKLPFVLVVVRLNQVHVFVGLNMCIATIRSDAESISAVYILSRKQNEKIFENSVCYHAYYDASTYEMTTAWAPIEPVNYGDRYVRYNYFPLPETVARDYYLYGFNTVQIGTVQFSQSIYDDKDWPKVSVVNDPVTGFQSGKFAIDMSLWDLSYFSAFNPPTPENQQVQTSKGILATLKSVLDYIKNLPKNIANSISSFFTDLGDRISGFFNSLGSKITNSFTTLQNYLLYFQATKPEHENPFSDILWDFHIFTLDYFDRFQVFANNIDSAYDNIVTYIESGSGIISSFLSALPLVEAFIFFFIVFCILRKVVGR